MRKKTYLKAAFHALPNTLAETLPEPGDWQSLFARPAPLWLELGCGRGDFTVELARRRPAVNILGVDLKSARMQPGAQTALEEGLLNLRFVREDVSLVAHRFAAGEVAQIWITFPDPYPKKKHARRRLTGPSFIEAYARILQPGGVIRFKTDNAELFDFTLETIADLRIPVREMTRDLHRSDLLNDENGVLTNYERRFIAEGAKICYLSFDPRAAS